MIELHSRYSVTEFQSLIERETDSIELKSGASQDKLQAAFVAFSNGDGGLVFIGVSDQRVVLGRRLDQGTDDRIHEAALAAFNVGRYKARQISVGTRVIVAVEVHRVEEGFAQTSDGRILVRRGGRNIALIGSSAWDFISSRALRRFERTRTKISWADADQDLVSELCATYGWDQDDDLPARLEERGLAVSGLLTVAGALFLTDPASSLDTAKAVIDIRRYQGDGPDYDRRVVIDGNLPHQVRAATEFVVAELGNDLIVTGVYRHEIPKLPEVVVREAIANAVAHRSYENDRTAILIEMRSAGVTVRSPGALPHPVTVETIRQAQAARNPDIIDVLRRFSLAEDAGRGVDVMEDEMQDALLDAPVFFDDGASVTVTLPLKGPITSRERAWVSELERQGQLSPEDRLLLVHAARGEELTNAAARTILGTEDSGAARRALQRLRDAALLDQLGARGSATYRLVEDLAPPAAFRLSPREISELLVSEAQGVPITNARVRELTGLDRAQTRSLLRRLVADGRLVQRGSRRGTYYTTP